MKLPPLISVPLSWLYGMVVHIRHKLFDLKILRSEEFDIPVVCIGNLTVGGTGKTPVAELLIERFSEHYRVGVLSRGYRRKTKGFVLSTPASSARTIGDEPRQMKLKYPSVPVAVCEKRAEGIRLLRKAHPEIELIILDDAFQHRYVEPWVNILLMDYNNPVYRDRLLPWGRLRDTRNQIHRANFVLVTKCPDDLNPLDMRIVINSLGLFPYQSLYFTRMRQGEITPLFADRAVGKVREGDPVIAMSGIANPVPLLENLRKRFDVVAELTFDDHHTYRLSDMRRLEALFAAYPDAVVLTTEKDAVKLTNRKKVPEAVQQRLYYVPIHVSFVADSESEFLRQLELYVRTNQKYSLLHPE
ncbi:tetraacyldisaccharide 4'-kinase [Alistipes sp.]|uniref:tetraacyldisaccharide 4'-kinase n=1 Tax=Alistipes sp. TaxID=1872444 RepID=UPI000E7F18A9|nr:tetraacyldisaccharide 4'-kinase [Alistipes sp.]HAY30004.1 tetraacyldisaccharide 4'-kinase [Alistipes sp.]